MLITGGLGRACWSDHDRVRIGAAVHSVRAVPAEALSVIGQVAGEQPLHVHLSEQPVENAVTQAFYGCTPTELLDDHGLLGRRTTVVHATHLADTSTSKPWVAARHRRASVRRRSVIFADGIGPARRLADAGSPAHHRSDQQAVIDPFEELRGVELHERLATGQRGRFPRPPS